MELFPLETNTILGGPYFTDDEASGDEFLKTITDFNVIETVCSILIIASAASLNVGWAMKS